MRPSSPAQAAKKSSKLWLIRQFRDPYVRQRIASPAQFRSRSAFKLLEIDEKYNVLGRGRPSSFSHPRIVVDLGAAPGGWSQVVALKLGYSKAIDGAHTPQPSDDPFDEIDYGLKTSARLASQGVWSDSVASGRDDNTSENPRAAIIAVDLARMQPIRGVTSIQADFFSPQATDLIRAHFPKDTPEFGVDIILSDMAANATGIPAVDVQNSLRICEAVLAFAMKYLAIAKGGEPGGVLVLKHFTHPDLGAFLKVLRKLFRRVYYMKPHSSRSESSEGYYLCVDRKGQGVLPLSMRLFRMQKNGQDRNKRSP